ncbi:MAG: MotA/TolQ/ExbB proton channel family protein, partial [Myxococcales bacterium]|nr:MotA/TolQ/ExbB proton channel family protein [Myxococcales bacterium]
MSQTSRSAGGQAPLLRLLPIGVAILGTAAAFAAAQALTPGRYATLLLERGWTQPVTVGLFFWGVGHALKRLWVQAMERRALKICKVAFVRDPIQPHAAGPMIQQLEPHKDSLAGGVAAAVLSYFRSHRPTRDEVVDVAHKAMDQARDDVELAYRPLNAVMWLLPLSGFVGTVLGMSAAIASFDGVISSIADNLSALAPSVQGLATAFDTTLLALVGVIPLKLMEVGLDARDQRLVRSIDDALGTGYVQRLDLAGIAQQSPLEAVLDRY